MLNNIDEHVKERVYKCELFKLSVNFHLSRIVNEIFMKYSYFERLFVKILLYTCFELYSFPFNIFHHHISISFFSSFTEAFKL
jgi:hypothetical protein